MAELITKSWIITCHDPAGGELELFKDGEFVHAFHVPAGRHRASKWTSCLGQGEEIRIGKACLGFPPRSGMAVSQHPDAWKSAANPAFQVTSASRMARQAAADLNAIRQARLQIQAEARLVQAAKLKASESIPDNLVVVEDPAPAVQPKLQGVGPA
jgi:hypothetical protein